MGSNDGWGWPGGGDREPTREEVDREIAYKKQVVKDAKKFQIDLIETRRLAALDSRTDEEAFKEEFDSLPEPGEMKWPADWGDVSDGEIPVDPHYDSGTCPHCGESLGDE